MQFLLIAKSEVFMGYLTNFIVYTLAMVGLMMFALFIFKKTTSGNNGVHSKYLKVIDSISIDSDISS